jgi:UDP-N-acetylmuramoyl-L-alanyl-D-glutamate--2,6-diaminopimelate ligase
MTRLKSLIPKPLLLAFHFFKAAAAVLAYGYPARALRVIGITGTDGKTTTAHLIYTILRTAGKQASLISTTGSVIYGRENEPLGLHVTTPSPFELQDFFKKARAAGSEYVVLEATSHGLAQHRILGSNVEVGVLTNISEEHLDWHGSYDQLLKDKARLFRGVRVSVLNRDDRSYELLRARADGRQLTYGLEIGVDLLGRDIDQHAAGMRFEIPALGETIDTGFVGEYNVQNMLAATGAALSVGIDGQHIKAGLEATTPPRGRMQRVSSDRDFTVFVDFAHTSNSLETMLHMARGLTDKKLIVVFGCAGIRDPSKRFPMGASAARYCDYTVLTAEDPRTEDLDHILSEVAAGCESEGGLADKTFFRVPDRQEAIEFAIQTLAGPGDIVVTTGKAHEQSMCFGAVEHDWDEFQAVEYALGVEGVQPVLLPTHPDFEAS